jgi:hypothetical protein
MIITERARFSRARLISILVGVLVLLITIFLYLYAFRGFPVNPVTIFINKSDIMDGKLVLSGSTASSAAAYSGYTYRQKDGKLMLRIRYVPVPNKWHPTSDFRIEISEKDMFPISEVYIYGKGNRERLIWTRTN